MNSSHLKNLVVEFGLGHELPGAEAETTLDALISETDERVIADVLRAWYYKGIEEGEIYEIARVLRERMKRVRAQHERFVDIVGTGGSKAKTFNVSTAASFVVAGAGIPVAKHGNKAATSNSGSADVISGLGVDPAVDAATAERCLNEIGICFMFAPNFHKLSPTLGKVRRGLGFPTIFNCVGPLCNPASAPNQLIGVWSSEMVPKIAGALARLGTSRSWVVHGAGGLDELSLRGATAVAQVGTEVREFEVTAEEFGIVASATDHLKAEGPDHSAKMIASILLGNPHAQEAEDLVLLNSAAAIFVAGGAPSYKEAAQLARESLRSGAARRKLMELTEAAPV